MKKSNKLLLGGIFTVLLFITAIHISFYAKLKAGNYTAYNAEDDLTALSMQPFPNILFVSVRDVPAANVSFSDVAKVENGGNDAIQYVRKGDTLQITGNLDHQGIMHPVAFQLPQKITLSVSNSTVSFESGKNTAQSSPVIHLDKAQLIFTDEEGPFNLGQLQVFASNNSIVKFVGKTQVDRLDVQLTKSTIESVEGHFGQLSILTDSSSRIFLPAGQLLRANIKTAVAE